MIEGDDKVNEMSYGNFEGTNQGNVKLLSKDNVQRIVAGFTERGIIIERPFCRTGFVLIEEATRRYNICRRTIYNYHKRGYITLCSSEGKTFVSIRELENHIRKNPLGRSADLKVAA
jgi:hypothetical protein